MTKQDALLMLNQAIGPGDIVEAIKEITETQEIETLEFGEALIEWIAQQLADEWDEEDLS